MQPIRTPDGRILAVHEGGAPDGVPVMMLHGTSGSGLLYEWHVRDARRWRIRLLSYDRPGYGRSTRDPGRNVADCARDIATICDALEIDRLCIWGISSGGAHALAAAALLPDRVAAVAALACVAPYNAEGLDFVEGMGERNVEDFAAALSDEASHRATLEREREKILAATPVGLMEMWDSLLGPADRAVLPGELSAYLLENMRSAVESGVDGWGDEDMLFSWPWGFELGMIRVPVLHRHGSQDRFVPATHGEWLAAQIPGVDSRITAKDGHLTLLAQRIPEVHAWLLDRFN